MVILSSRNVNSAVRWKLGRIREGAPPRVLDLFAGCGGMSLGARRAGCELLGAIEVDAHAAESHALNFHDGNPAHGLSRDIGATDPEDFLREIGHTARVISRRVDMLIGGPPCQAFARVGRAKLREVMDRTDAFLHDPRSGLYKDYIRFVERLAPVAVVVENVPDVLNYGGTNVFEAMSQDLERLGYDCAYGLINAAHHGVPQFRLRCFLVGVSKCAGTVPALPAGTHFSAVPTGYRGAMNVALRSSRTLFGSSRFIEVPTPTRDKPASVTAKEALEDLPKITEHLNGLLRKGPQRLNSAIPAPAPAQMSSFARAMRTWPGFEATGEIVDHAIRFLPRDYPIFRRMQPGDQYPEAHAIAEKMLAEAAATHPSKPGSEPEMVNRLRAQIVPPYDPNKFPNKWRKLDPDAPARTLMAHLGKDSYSHIHYDSNQARTISVREAARLQSFPDGFRFAGTMNPAFRQIGNAVPPLLAAAVLGKVVNTLTTSPS